MSLIDQLPNADELPTTIAPPRPPRIGDKIQTEFMQGAIIGIVNGKDRRWSDELYFLVKPYKYNAHWVRQSEVITREGGPI